MNTMKDIIPPVSSEAIMAELSHEKFFRKTNNGGNEIYILTAHDSPNVMREIGRLREISFRDSGGGTGMDCDIDEFDICEDHCFKQLIVWNPVDKVIVGGYRFLLCEDMPIDENGQVSTPTSELFHYSEKFVHDFLPYTIELGRSFVQPDYQQTKRLSKGMYSLDNLWDGLGSLIDLYPQAKYYFGKVTMYPQLDRVSRDMILYFMQSNFPDPDELVRPYPQYNLPILTESERLKQLFTGETYKDNYRILVRSVRERGAAVPPLVNAYMNLSSSMRSFGTALNSPFGNVEETGILITIADIYESKVQRHLLYEKGLKPEHLK